MAATGQSVSHAQLMDATYRYQRHIYDVTRRFYLLGRNHLIDRLAPPAGGSVLEVACGTGRNLARVAALHPGRRLYGVDISREMLSTARARMAGRATLAEGDACSFSGADLFGAAAFDRIVFSYCLSMIPEWRGAIENAVHQLGAGGQIHVVDFGDQANLPRWFGRGLRAWLGNFHVSPRDNLAEVLEHVAAGTGTVVRTQPLFMSYVQYAVLTRS